MKKLIALSFLFCVHGLISSEESKLQAACLKGILNRRDGTTEEIPSILYKNENTSDFKMLNIATGGKNDVYVEELEGKPVTIFLKKNGEILRDTYVDLKAEKIIVEGIESGKIACVPCEEMISLIFKQMLSHEEAKRERISQQMSQYKEKLEEQEKVLEKLKQQQDKIKKIVNRNTDKLKEDINNVLK